MSEIDCTCKSQRCYDCRRQVIDAMALQIVQREVKYCTGMHGFDVSAHAWQMANDWRRKAINALAFEMIEQA